MERDKRFENQRDMAYGDFKDLIKTAAPDNVLRNKEFGIPKDPNLDGYQSEFAFIDYNFFDIKSADTGRHSNCLSVGSFIKSNNTEVIPSEQLTNKLHKSVIRKFKKM